MNILFFFSMLLLSTFSWSGAWKEEIINDARLIYAPVALRAFNKPLHISIKDAPTLGGSAQHDHDQLAVIIDSGLLASPRLTPDGLRMILCHELGHLFGGAPRKNIPMEWDGPIADDGFSMMSSEGQADYYAGLICFKKLLELPSADSALPDFNRVGARLKDQCGVEGGLQGRELQNCLRAGLAGEDFLKLVFDFPISCESYDHSVANELIRDFYPGRQCRLDTILRGALCNENTTLVLDFDLGENNSCQSPYATRPQCWFPAIP